MVNLVRGEPLGMAEEKSTGPITAMSFQVSTLHRVCPERPYSRDPLLKMSLRICGPKMALCGCLLSAWGICQLVVLGWFRVLCRSFDEKRRKLDPLDFAGLAFQSRSIALVEDLALDETLKDSHEDYFLEMEKAFDRGANNCYIAALLYLVTLLVSLHQHWLNRRGTVVGYERYS